MREEKINDKNENCLFVVIHLEKLITSPKAYVNSSFHKIKLTFWNLVAMTSKKTT